MTASENQSYRIFASKVVPAPITFVQRRRTTGMSRGTRLSLEETPYDHAEFSRLWIVATTTYGVGDIVTTIALIQFSESVNEGNGLLGTAIDTFGLWGLVGIKLVAFAVCLAFSLGGARDADPLLYYGPPTALSLVGAFTTVYNVRLLIG